MVSLPIRFDGRILELRKKLGRYGLAVGIPMHLGLLKVDLARGLDKSVQDLKEEEIKAAAFNYIVFGQIRNILAYKLPIKEESGDDPTKTYNP